MNNRTEDFDDPKSNEKPSLDQGIKVSKRRFNVLNPDNDKTKQSSDNISPLPYLLYALALPYLYGAKQQVNRYQIAATRLKQKPVLGVYECLHEASTLFEDLNTVARYVEKCDNENGLHKLWLDIRNHIRHDVREEFDNETDKRKSERVKRLKIHPNLQTSIGFSVEYLKVGETKVEIQQINSYLVWAEDIMARVLSKAKQDGHIK